MPISLRNGIARTLRCGFGKDGLDPAKVRDLRTYVGQMQFGARLHFDASLRAAVNQREQAANFLDREAERTRAHDEAKATNVFLAIEAIAFGDRKSTRLNSSH